MHAATTAFHRALIRMLKGILAAWETWLNDRHTDSRQ